MSMIRSLWIEVRKLLHGHRMGFGILICAGIYGVGILGELPLHGTVQYHLDAATFVSSFTMLFPLAAAFAAADLFLIDYESRTYLLVLQRTRFCAYALTKFISAVVAGGFIMSGGVLLFVLALRTALPWGKMDATNVWMYMRETVHAQDWFSFFSFYITLQGIAGLFWGGFCLTLSVFIPNRTVAYMAPVVCVEIFDRIMRIFGLTTMTNLATGMVEAKTPARMLVKSVIVFFPLLLICFCLYYPRMRRRILHG